MQTASITEAPGLSPTAVLAPLVVAQAARARAFMDQTRLSATYGCADRPYWYYRTLSNYPCADYQQVMLAFAALYKTEDAANPYANDPAMFEAASAALSFWAQSQHRDGSFDEWYLNERSYCPTAITSAGAALTLDLIGGELAHAVRESALKTLRKAGRWLDARYNPTVMNQNLAAAVALTGLAKVEGGAWAGAAANKLARVRADQNAEGWFPEYGGADLGYSTFALDLLAACHSLSGADPAAEMAASLCKFLVSVQGGWRALAGRLGSRGTSHAFPYGALYFAAHDANAADLAGAWLEGLDRGLAAKPEAIDDRYFAYFYLPQFAMAYRQASRSNAMSAARVPDRRTQDFGRSGFISVRREAWSALISRCLGGAVAIAGADGAITYHLGYEVLTDTNKRFSSAVWAHEGGTPLLSVDGELVVATPFATSSSGLPLKHAMAPFQITVGMLATSDLAAAFQEAIKSRMVAPKGSCGLRLERHIVIGENGLRIRDTLTPQPGSAFIRRLDVANSISMYSPSARQDPATNLMIADTALEQARIALNAAHPVTFVVAIEGPTGRARLEYVA